MATVLQKIAAARMSAEEKVQAHHQAEKKDWKGFEQSLRSDAFRRAVLKAAESDPKLKKYVRTFGAYQGSQDVVAEIKSKDSGRRYKIKDLHNGRLGCSCRDWQFIHSVRGGDCKHIKSLKQSRMLRKTAFAQAALPALQGARFALRTHQKMRKGRLAVQSVRGAEA